MKQSKNERMILAELISWNPMSRENPVIEVIFPFCVCPDFQAPLY